MNHFALMARAFIVGDGHANAPSALILSAGLAASLGDVMEWFSANTEWWWFVSGFGGFLPGRSGGRVPVASGEKRAAFAACRGRFAVWHVVGVVVAGCGGVANAPEWFSANTEWWLGIGVVFCQHGVVAGYPLPGVKNAPLLRPVAVCVRVGLMAELCCRCGVAQVVADPGRGNLAGHGHQDDQTLSSAALSATAQGAL